MSRPNNEDLMALIKRLETLKSVMPSREHDIEWLVLRAQDTLKYRGDMRVRSEADLEYEVEAFTLETSVESAFPGSSATTLRAQGGYLLAAVHPWFRIETQGKNEATIRGHLPPIATVHAIVTAPTAADLFSRLAILRSQRSVITGTTSLVSSNSTDVHLRVHALDAEYLSYGGDDEPEIRCRAIGDSFTAGIRYCEMELQGRFYAVNSAFHDLDGSVVVVCDPLHG